MSTSPVRHTLDPKNDVVFKLLFAAEANRDLLIALLTAVLDPESPITAAEVMNPEVDREHWDDKGTVLDIRLRFTDGTQADPHPACTASSGSANATRATASARPSNYTSWSFQSATTRLLSSKAGRC
jgi:hypothetical protein